MVYVKSDWPTLQLKQPRLSKPSYSTEKVYWAVRSSENAEIVWMDEIHFASLRFPVNTNKRHGFIWRMDLATIHRELCCVGGCSFAMLPQAHWVQER